MSEKLKKLFAGLREFSERYRHTSLDPRTLKPRYIFGIFLICLSFAVGWGIPAAAIVYAFHKKIIVVPAAVGVGSYIASWGIFSAGMFLSTKQSLMYLRALGAKIIHSLIDHFDRVTIFQLTGFFCAAGAISAFFVFGISRQSFLTLGAAFLIHQTVLVCSLVVQNNSLLNRPVRGKTLNLVADVSQIPFILRFDDGPGLLTEALLDILEEAKVRAFFCVTGEKALRYPQIIRRVFSAGHIIVNHTADHPMFFSLLSRKKLYCQIGETQKILREITGTAPVFFAAPMGHGNLFLKTALKANDLLLLGWDINARDALKITTGRTEKLFKKIKKSKTPQIILLHDSSYSSSGERQGFLELVETVIRLIV